MRPSIHVSLTMAMAALASCASSTTATRAETSGATPPQPRSEAPPAETSPAASASSHEHPAQAAPSESRVEPAQTQAPPDLLAEEQRAYEAARPVFERYCTKCHTSRGAQARRSTLRHLNMDTYPFGGHHAHEMGSLTREVLGVTGDKPTMPRDKKGALKGEELALIVAWTEAFDRSHAAGLHKHHEQQGHQHGHQH